MRTTMITGVSSGLGAALFDHLHARGDRVIAIGRRFTDAQHSLAVAEPGRVRLHASDLADTAQVPAAAAVAALLAGPDGAGVPAGTTSVDLIHNAGVLEPIGAVGTLPADRIARAVAVNLTAPMLLTNALLAATRGYLDAGGDAARVRVLFISSGAAEHVVEGWAAYCATKAGGRMFFDVLAAQAAADPRLTVASVNPGVMDTTMQATIRASTAGYFPRRARYQRLHDEGKLPDPADVAARIIAEYLA